MRRLAWTGAAICLVAASTPLTASAGTTDPYASRQWGLTRIQAEAAWQSADGTGIVIAIVDTGVDLEHPDLAGKLVIAPGSDLVDRSKGCKGAKAKKAKAARACKDDGPQDENGHGTHVAGIAAAITDNGTGVAGTAPGASILPVRALDKKGDGDTDDVAAGIRHAVEHGAQVVNLSLGVASGVDKLVKTIGLLDPIYDAIDHAYDNGAVVVAAAGNDSFPICSEPSAHPHVLCVGATDRNDVRSFYSNSDATMTSEYLVAPGGDELSCSGSVISTYLHGAETACSPEAGYESLSGTSMAAPFVSGVAALLLDKGLTNQQVVDCITATTDDLGTPGRDALYGHGRVNALRAVSNC